MTNFKLNVARTERNESRSASREERPKVDYDALNAHIIAASGTAKKKRSLPAIISQIVDLGIQERRPYEGEWTEKDAAKPGAEEFTVRGKRMIRVPMKPVQQVAIMVDIPGVLVDKGQFYGDASNPLPLRLSLNGEFGYRDNDNKWVRIIDRGYILSEVRDDKNVWALSKLNGLHKLADAAGILDDDGYFQKERVGELLGKAVQVEFRVYMKPGKDGKEFFTEEVKLVGAVPEGITVPDYDFDLIGGVNLNGENDEKTVKQLRVAYKNTIRRASNYPGSDIQKLLEASTSPSSERPATTHAATPSNERTAASGAVSEDDVKAAEDAFAAAAEEDDPW